METPSRSTYPDAPLPEGDRHGTDWIIKPYAIVITSVFLFIIIFGLALFLCWRQVESARHNALINDKTTANLLANIIIEHNKSTIGILQSYAHRPVFVEAVKNKDLMRVHKLLSDIKKNADIDLTFITDTDGTLWANYPVFPESIGKDLSHRDWYKGIISHWKPYISTVFKLIVGDKPLAVAICVPIRDDKEKVVGILATSERLGFLADTIVRVPLSPYTSVNVIDRVGHVLYSNKYTYEESITDYRFFPLVEKALKENKRNVDMIIHREEQLESYLTCVPVKDSGWLVIIERNNRDLYRLEYAHFIEIGVISLLLYLLIISSLAYFQKVASNRRTAENLQAERRMRQSEESEREARDYLENLIGHANAPIIVWDNQLRITRFNRAFENLVGLKAEEVLGRGIDLLFPEDSREECMEKIRQTTGGERWELIELPILNQDGSIRNVLWNSASLFNSNDNTVVATLAQGLDITEHKGAEKQIQRQTKLLAAINSIFFESLSLDDVGAVAKACLSLAQEITESKFGFIGEITPEGLFTTTALSDPGWDACRVPENRADALIKDMVIRGIWGQVLLKEQSLIANDPASYPDRIGTPQGHPSIISFLGVPLKEHDKVIGMIALANRVSGYTAEHQHDIEALAAVSVEAMRRKQAEISLERERHRYSELFENIAIGICRTTPGNKGTFVDVNPAMLNIFEAENKEQLMALSPSDIYLDNSQRSIVSDMIISQGIIMGFDIKYKTLKGKPIWCHISAKKVDIDGQVYFDNTIEDITAKKQLEEELYTLKEDLENRVRQRTAQLNEANKELEAFAYAVSHDLRAPLRSIDGFSLAMLEDCGDKLNGVGKNYLERVRKATQHMGRLIDDMLKLSRIMKSELFTEFVDLSSMVRVIAEEKKNSNPERNVDVIVRDGIVVHGDFQLINIAMENLIDNAWKFTGQVAHPRVEFGTTVKDGKVVCFIRDNGVGFEMAYAGKLFVPFQRLHSQDQFTGTGIGLATVQRIMNRHGAHIWAEGEVGKGATFYFTLSS